MTPDNFMEFSALLEKLKCNVRHSWTSTGRRESVAEHSWRLAVYAMLLEKDFPELDMGKVIRMCLIHDWGEAVTGDIPAFIKTGADEATEDAAVESILQLLPEEMRPEFGALFDEMKRQETDEARLYKALDRMEAVIQHNEAPITTWLPLEYDLQLTYGEKETEAFAFTRELKEAANRITADKIRESGR